MGMADGVDRHRAQARERMIIFWGKLAFCLSLALASTRVYSAEKPNILFMLVDDMGWSDLGCYGSEIATPNIDSLAKSGLRFTEFYNTAKCNTSRACLLTGLYAQQFGMMAPQKITNATTLARCCVPPVTTPLLRASIMAQKTC